MPLSFFDIKKLSDNKPFLIWYQYNGELKLNSFSLEVLIKIWYWKPNKILTEGHVFLLIILSRIPMFKMQNVLNIIRHSSKTTNICFSPGCEQLYVTGSFFILKERYLLSMKPGDWGFKQVNNHWKMVSLYQFCQIA